MPHRHRIDGCGNVIVARMPRDDRASTLSPEDVDHVRVLAFESLARESTYLARHAEDMWMGENVRCGEDRGERTGPVGTPRPRRCMCARRAAISPPTPRWSRTLNVLRADKGRREHWSGLWWANGRRVKKRVGLKRAPGSRDGLTRTQAEAELRRLMEPTTVAPPVRGGALTVEALGERYVRHLRHQGRKKSTLTAVRSVLDNWLVPHFGDRAIDRIEAEDVVDLMAKMQAAALAAEPRSGSGRSRSATTSGR